MQEILIVGSNAFKHSQTLDSHILSNYFGNIIMREILINKVKNIDLKSPILITPTILFINNLVEVSRLDATTITISQFYKTLGAFKLTKEAFNVAFSNGTDNRFCQQYDIFKDTLKGVFMDKLSGIALFDTQYRFDSGSGWLSFYKAIDGSVIEKIDSNFGMNRIEVIAKVSGIHLGHVFNDTPNGGRRFCINASILDFVAN